MIAQKVISYVASPVSQRVYIEDNQTMGTRDAFTNILMPAPIRPYQPVNGRPLPGATVSMKPNPGQEGGEGYFIRIGLMPDAADYNFNNPGTQLWQYAELGPESLQDLQTRWGASKHLMPEDYARMIDDPQTVVSTELQMVKGNDQSGYRNVEYPVDTTAFDAIDVHTPTGLQAAEAYVSQSLTLLGDTYDSYAMDRFV